MKNFVGKTALVTGASSGIGKAVAHKLASLGIRVVVVGRNKHAIDEVAASLPAQAIAIVCDVSNSDAVEAMVESAWIGLNGIDYLVHAAGIVTPSRIEALSPSLWREHIDVNLSGAFYVMRETALRMRKKGDGSIVCIGSDLSCVGAAMYTHYCASKAGLAGMTKAFAMELAPTVRVNCVCPGPVDTPMMDSELELFGGTEEVREKFLSNVPLKRFATPDEIADFIVFVVTQATFATGSILSVDGGTTAS